MLFRSNFGQMADTEIPECDIIISNPPYTLKTQVLQRLFEIGKPFAMLVGVVGLFESEERFSMFRDNDFELLYFNRRISFFQNFDDQKPKLNPPFSSVYVTSKLLPKKINFESIDKHACKYISPQTSTEKQ